MKKTIHYLFAFLLVPMLLSAADHLLFTEIVMQPLGAEYVKIKNPGSSAVDLGNYYLSDAEDNVNGKHYYNLPSGQNYWSGAPDDFIARFPDVTLAAGQEIIVGAYSSTEFEAAHKFAPDYALINGGMRQAVDGQTTIGTFTFINRFATSGESLILFYWDGTASPVQDVDYLLWGSRNFAVDKSGVSGYADDTPAASQSMLSAHLDGQKLIRKSDSEGTEPASGGNGITGHDETGENLTDTWTTAALIFPKPKITNLLTNPVKPSTRDDVTFSCTVTDSVGLASVVLTTIAGEDTLKTDMSEGAASLYSATLNFRGSAADKVSWYVTATNTQSFETISTVKTLSLLVEVTIREIQQNLADWVGKIVNVSGVVISRADNVGGGSNILLDDGSGTITIRIWNTDNILVGTSGSIINEDLDALLQFGTRIRLSATVDEYNGDAQLVPASADDFSEYSSGSEGDGKLVLDVAPYPFVPQLGEMLKYHVEYPENCRVILRVYDYSGRFICALMDEQHGLSWQFDDTWNGRDELNHLVAPGKYLLVLESTNLKTAAAQRAIAPVVVGVKF